MASFTRSSFNSVIRIWDYKINNRNLKIPRIVFETKSEIRKLLAYSSIFTYTTNICVYLHGKGWYTASVCGKNALRCHILS